MHHLGEGGGALSLSIAHHRETPECILCESYAKDMPRTSKIYTERPRSMKPKTFSHVKVVEFKVKIPCRGCWGMLLQEILKFRYSKMQFAMFWAAVKHTDTDTEFTV